jgi:hypothetical protein
MTMTPLENLQAQVDALEARKMAIIKQLMAKFRTPAIDATDRAAAAQAGITMDDARLLRVHLETKAIDAQLTVLHRAIETL